MGRLLITLLPLLSRAVIVSRMGGGEVHLSKSACEVFARNKLSNVGLAVGEGEARLCCRLLIARGSLAILSLMKRFTSFAIRSINLIARVKNTISFIGYINS
jgi:hypothetical protein